MRNKLHNFFSEDSINKKLLQFTSDHVGKIRITLGITLFLLSCFFMSIRIIFFTMLIIVLKELRRQVREENLKVYSLYSNEESCGLELPVKEFIGKTQKELETLLVKEANILIFDATNASAFIADIIKKSTKNYYFSFEDRLSQEELRRLREDF